MAVAHQHIAGPESATESLERSAGGLSTKLDLPTVAVAQ